MPFTFSHPAIVLPLAYLPRRWFSLTGLIVGSMTPDFEYFLRMRMRTDYSHSISGLFWFDLPLGLLLAFLFHNIVRDRLVDNLPGFLKSRLAALCRFEWNGYFKKHWLVVMVSILLGACSHLLWDNFTHAHGYFVEAIPALANTVVFSGMQIPVFKLLQHSGTVIGGLIIAFAICKLPPDNNVTGNMSAKYWAVVIGVTLAIVAIRIFCGLDFKQYGHLIATGISAGLISLVLTSWLFMGKELNL